MDWKRVVLGIGNPGIEYADTRHNIGFMVLDVVAERLGLSFSRLERRSPDGARRFSGKVKARVAPGLSGHGEPFLLVKPWTYVNLSGQVAGPLMADLPADALFVVLDDLNLPLGRIRVRPAGSAGGHNGLVSIGHALADAAYPRLRLGIGEPDVPAEDWVLSRFSPEEREVLAPVLESAADAICEWLGGGSVESLMNCYNSSRSPDP
ncbi:MAG: aminoacyl-tRNA hydrolase [Planctomycetota bacterium]|nr:aminoacyl-tRNA hydrolase [Planctomycetota bacterium]